MCTSRSLEEVDFWSRVTKQSEAVANVFSYPAVGVNLERKGRSGHWEEMMGHFNRCWVRFLMPGSGSCFVCGLSETSCWSFRSQHQKHVISKAQK